MTGPGRAAVLLVGFLNQEDEEEAALALRGAIRAALVAGPAASPQSADPVLAWLPLRVSLTGPEVLVPVAELTDPQAALARIAAAWAELALTRRLDRLRLCAEPSCGRAFWDGSPNRSRRWCSMRLCGNRLKQRRHQARTALG